MSWHLSKVSLSPAGVEITIPPKPRRGECRRGKLRLNPGSTGSLLMSDNLGLKIEVIIMPQQHHPNMSNASVRLLGTAGMSPRRFRFGAFELDARAGELRKHGSRMRIRQQAVQLLRMLLEHAGDVVLRDEIRRELWPDNTVVEFDHSINVAVQRLREVLGDSPENPRFIETLTGRGYRFLAAVETSAPPDLSGETSGAALPAPTLLEPAPRRRISRDLKLITAMVTLTLLAIAGWVRPRTADAPVRNWIFSLGAVNDAVVSPDGSAAIYRDGRGLFLRRFDTAAEIPLYTQSPLRDAPAWSADGSEVLFRAGAGLIKMRVPHGPAVNIWPEAPTSRRFAWGPAGDILATVIRRDGKGELYLIPASGGPAAPLKFPELNVGLFYEPEFLPTNGDFIFTWAGDGEEQAGIYLASLNRGKVVRGPLLLRRNVTAARFAPEGGGRLLYVQDDRLFAQNLNAAAGKLEGAPQQLVDGVFSISNTRHAAFSVSRNGVLTWTPGKAALAQLTWLDRQGNVIGTAGQPCGISSVLLSPDEKHLLIGTDNEFAAFLDPHQSAVTPLRRIVKGIWMPDSAHVLYLMTGSEKVIERDLARGGEREVARLPDIRSLRDVSPDGKVLLYSADKRTYAIPLGGPAGSPSRVI